MGMNKVSFEDRVGFSDSNMENIRLSAASPLEHSWWREAEDPFQFLACCMEISKAYEHPDGPANYPCSLPIHQDGSCNGLQHYAALGRDALGGKAVNLLPSDTPQDVYTSVCNRVKEKVAKDAVSSVSIFYFYKCMPLLNSLMEHNLSQMIYFIFYCRVILKLRSSLRYFEGGKQLIVRLLSKQ